MQTAKRGMAVKKVSIKEWAAIAEIVGTAGVIISLLFVAISISRNTLVLQSANSTLMYELDAAAITTQIEDGEFAKFSAKRSYGLEFADPNEARFFYFVQNQLTHWELLIYRYQDGLVADAQYLDWSDYYADKISRDLKFEWWNAVKTDYTQDLVEAVDAALAAE
jgi:hypothetical protein